MDLISVGAWRGTADASLSAPCLDWFVSGVWLRRSRGYGGGNEVGVNRECVLGDAGAW
jgi:hypothetical protein